jgi:hypothetical protein
MRNTRRLERLQGETEQYRELKAVALLMFSALTTIDEVFGQGKIPTLNFVLERAKEVLGDLPSKEREAKK